MKKTLSAFFLEISAPLRNVRWSWGAKRADGSIVFRAWNDELLPDGKGRLIRLTNHAFYDGLRRNNGWNERLRQIEEVRQGAPAFVVICEARKPLTTPRKLVSYGASLVPVASIQFIDGDEWAQLDT